MVGTLLIGLAGLVGVLVGSEFTIKGSKNIARRYGISEYVIGLTILSIGTSLPEIFTHIFSSIEIWFNPEKIVDLSGIAVGSNIGSNIIQGTFVTGLIGLITLVKTTKSFLKKDYVMLLAATFLLWLFSLDGIISRGEGIFLAVTYIYYIYWLITHEKEEYKDLKHHKPQTKLLSIKSSIIYLLIGLLMLSISADFVLNSAIFFTETLDIKGSLIGVVIIGVCTALPEFTAAFTAIRQGSTGMSLGTLIGSNITNPMLALGLGAMISRYQLDFAIIYVDIPYLLLISLIGLWFFWTKLSLNRWESITLIVLYAVFVSLRFLV